MAKRKRVALVLAMLVVCVGCDQKTKYLAREHLHDSPAISLLGGTLRLDYSENTGGFLSLGSALPSPWRVAIFNAACSAAIAAILWYTLVAPAGRLQIIGLSLICAGGIGNLIDRWAYGYARDFLNLGLGPVRTGIFNVADVALVTGCLLLMMVRRPT
jgi:signal peptidase II